MGPDHHIGDATGGPAVLRRCAIALSLTLLAPTLAQAVPAEVKNVAASYRIDLAGVNFGSYNFTSIHTGADYKVASNAKLKAFFGAFKWRGAAYSSGTIGRAGPVPRSYLYNYRKNKRKPKTVTVTMADGNATTVKHEPPRNRNKRRVAITGKHKFGVLDPMSALVAMSAPANGGDPCRQTVHVFDGSYRFDVKLSPKGKQRIEARRGFSSRIHVCRVTYKPIAGHKRGKSTNYISDPDGAEVWMMPANDGLMYVPYRISIPTLIGSAVLRLHSVKITLADDRVLALTN